LATHPWLRDHAVLETVLLPGTGFVELALRAGAEVGCEVVEELTLEAPLVLAEEGAVQVQLTLSEPDADGRRQMAIHSRPEQTSELKSEEDWTRHASGALAPAAGVDAAAEQLAGEAWPPAGADQVEVDALYDRLAELGLAYGPM